MSARGRGNAGYQHNRGRGNANNNRATVPDGSRGGHYQNLGGGGNGHQQAGNQPAGGNRGVGYQQDRAGRDRYHRGGNQQGGNRVAHHVGRQDYDQQGDYRSGDQRQGNYNRGGCGGGGGGGRGRGQGGHGYEGGRGVANQARNEASMDSLCEMFTRNCKSSDVDYYSICEVTEEQREALKGVINVNVPKLCAPIEIGLPVKLSVNHFPLIIKFSDQCIFKYDVEIKVVGADGVEKTIDKPGKRKTQDRNVEKVNKTEKARVMHAFLKQVCKETGADSTGIVYDGSKIIYSLHQLTADVVAPYTATQSYHNNSRLSITIKETTTIDLSLLTRYASMLSSGDPTKLYVGTLPDDKPSRGELMNKQFEQIQECFQTMDVVFRHMLSSKLERYGKSYFNLTSSIDRIQLGDVEVLMRGFFTNVRFSFGSIALNMDVSNGVFVLARSLWHYLKDTRFDFQRYKDTGYVKSFSSSVHGLRVKIEHLPYVKYEKIKELIPADPYTVTFDCEGKETTVAQYFKEKYKKDLQRNLPMVRMSRRNSMYPLEVCAVPTTKLSGQLNPAITRKMIMNTATLPSKRKEDILERITLLKRLDENQMLAAWGIEVKDSMPEVEGRILTEPTIFYANDLQVKTFNKGEWRMERVRYCKTPGLVRWHAAVLTNDGAQFTSFMDRLKKTGKMIGLNLADQGRVEVIELNQLYSFVTAMASTADILFMVNDPATSNYAAIKSVSELMTGKITQVLKPDTLYKNDVQTCINVCHKINGKLSGINWKLFSDSGRNLVYNIDLHRFDDVMFVGIDVTHSVGVRGAEKVSIAAVVASMDTYASAYRARMCCQKNLKKNRKSMETVLNIKKMMQELLLAYREKNNRFPDKIIVYRDGVSEGQFQPVLSYELMQIRDSIQAVGMPSSRNSVNGTYIVVQKRHHTRMFPSNNNNQSCPTHMDKNGNMVPGTVVDSGICMKTTFDFFLCSHRGIKGTSRPTYYRVLYDRLKLSRQNVATMTYALCHTYARCTRAVSVPAPCFYAHLVAFRARYYLNFLCRSENEIRDYVIPKTSSEKSVGSDDDKEDYSLLSLHVNPEIETKMFFL